MTEVLLGVAGLASTGIAALKRECAELIGCLQWARHKVRDKLGTCEDHDGSWLVGVLMNYEDDAVGFFPQSILRVDDGVKLGAAGRG